MRLCGLPEADVLGFGRVRFDPVSDEKAVPATGVCMAVESENAVPVQRFTDIAGWDTTMRYDRARVSLDRHATYIVSTFIAGAAR